MAADEVRVQVFVDDPEEQRLAQTALGRVRPDEVVVYAGVVEGWTDDAGLAELAAASLVVDPLDRPAPDQAASPPPALITESRRTLHHESPELAEFKQQSKFIALGQDGFQVSDQHVTGDAFDPRIHDVGESGLQPAPEDALDQAVYHIALRAPITGEQRDAFDELGISFAAYEPPRSYRAFMTRAQYTKVLTLPYVESIERCRLAETVTPQFLDEISEGTGADEGPSLLSTGPEPEAQGPKTFDVILHRVADLDKVVDLVRSIDGSEVLEASHLYIRFRAPSDERYLAAVAKLPEVRRLDVYNPPSLFSDRVRVLVGIETTSTAVPAGLTGEGEKVAVFDSGIDASHPDLADRIESVEAVEGASEDDEVGHGTHVAGIIAGTGKASDGKIRGMAPGAKLAVVGIVHVEGMSATVLTPANWADLLQRAVDKDAKIVNLSTGRLAYGEYDFGSLSMDEFVYQHPDVLIVVAAGNEGAAPEGYVGFGSIFSPASAKNVLTVGASCSDRQEPAVMWGEWNPNLFPMAPANEALVAGVPDVPAAISSRGPTEFDSVKPDLLAPGTQVLSARAAKGKRFWPPDYTEFGGKYAYMGGTSMAAPVVAGAAAVLRQYLRTQKDKSDPSAALLKALLIAATKRIPARDLPEEVPKAVGYPDFDQGFGVLDLATVVPDKPPTAPRRILQFVDWANDSDEALVSRPVDTNRDLKKSRTYCVTVGEGSTEPLQVVLVWTDWPSAGVQNNLHLELTGPDAAVSGNPEHLYHRTGVDTLLRAYEDPRRLGAQRIPVVDKNNNVERITLEPVKPGEYCVKILADNTPFHAQGYALCVVGDLESELTAVG